MCERDREIQKEGEICQEKQKQYGTNRWQTLPATTSLDFVE
jgi:hypothetical protein